VDAAPEGGASRIKAFFHAIGATVALLLGSVVMLAGTGFLMEQRPDLETSAGIAIIGLVTLLWLTGVVWAAVKSGAAWAIACFFLGPLAVVAHAYHASRGRGRPRLPSLQGAAIMAALGLLLGGAAFMEESTAETLQPAASGDVASEAAVVRSPTATATPTRTPTKTATPLPTATTRPKPKNTATREPSPTPNPDASFDPEELAFNLLYGYEGEVISRSGGVPEGAVDSFRISYYDGELRFTIYATDTEARDWLVAQRSGEEFPMEYWSYPSAVQKTDGACDYYAVVGNVVVKGSTSYELMIESGYTEDEAKEYVQVAAWIAEYGVDRVIEAGGFAPEESNSQTAHSWSEWAVT
jgi:hypothetical protein